MGVNKFIYGGTTKFDLTGDDVTQADVLSGKTFHNAAGNQQTGMMPNQGAKVAKLDLNNNFYDIPYGRHNGEGYVYINTQQKTVTPTSSQQIITPDSGKVLSQVTVNASTGIDTSDATVTSNSQILSGYTAYSKGTKYTGNITQRSASNQTITSAKTFSSGYYPNSWTVTPGRTDPVLEYIGCTATRVYYNGYDNLPITMNDKTYMYLLLCTAMDLSNSDMSSSISSIPVSEFDPTFYLVKTGPKVNGGVTIWGINLVPYADIMGGMAQDVWSYTDLSSASSNKMTFTYGWDGKIYVTDSDRVQRNVNVREFGLIFGIR